MMKMMMKFKLSKAKSRTKKTSKLGTLINLRAKTAFIIWSSSDEGVKKIKVKILILSILALFVKPGKVWKIMKENNETGEYDTLALKDKERYENEMGNYNA